MKKLNILSNTWLFYFFGIFKLIGLNSSRNISAWIFVKLGFFMKKNKTLIQNLSNAI